MRATYVVPGPSTTTVNTLAEELYDIYVPTSGTESVDTARQSAVAAALRAANPTLPTNEAAIAVGTWLYLPRVSEAPYRIPPTNVSLRTALSAQKIRNVETISLMTQPYLASLQGLSSFAVAEIDKIRLVSALMLLPGMDPQTATHLYDSTPSVTTLAELAEISQATLKGHLTTRSPNLPGPILDLRPWFVLQHRARRRTRKGKRISSTRVVPVSPKRIEEQLGYWLERSRRHGTRSAERDSADAIHFLYGVAVDVLKGNALLALGEYHAAYARLRAVWTAIGARGAAQGVFNVNEPKEIDGPSVDGVLRVLTDLVPKLRPVDVAEARRRLGLAPERRKGGMRSFRIGDLTSTAAATLDSALGNSTEKVDTFHHDVFERFGAALSESDVGDLPAAAQYALERPTKGWQVSQFPSSEKSQVLDNLRAMAIGAAVSGAGTAWNALKGDLPLAGMRVMASDPNLAWTSSTDRLLDDVKAEFSTAFLGATSPFDAFVSWSPVLAPEAGARHVPFNANFRSRHVEDVLKPLALSGDGAQFDLGAEDFEDPARLAVVLPILMAHHLPLSLADALAGLGHERAAMAILGAVADGHTRMQS